MPQYIFSNPANGEMIGVFQGMNEKHEYVDSQGVKWDRVFTSPNAAVDGNINPFSPADFVNKTRDKHDSVGDLWDRSREASDKRAEKIGIDPVKEKYYKEWGKKRKGRRHPAVADREIKKSLKKLGVSVS